MSELPLKINTGSYKPAEIVFSEDENAVLVQLAMYHFCAPRGIRSVRALYSALTATPTVFSIRFNWTYEQVEDYRKDLIAEAVKGGMDASIFIPRAPAQHATGAMSPKWMLGRRVEQIEAINREAEKTSRPAEDVSNDSKWNLD